MFTKFGQKSRMEGTTRGRWEYMSEKQCGRTMSELNWQGRGTVGTVIHLGVA